MLQILKFRLDRRLILLIACSAPALSSAVAQTPARSNPQIDRVYADQDGTVHVALVGGKSATIRKEKDQVGADDFKVASDGRTAGWTELYPNCCTSYPIPLAIAVYRDGRVRRRFRPTLMIYRWQFWEDGRQIAYCSGTVHGDQGVTCELHDVASGRELASFDGLPDERSPAWARALQR
jgi:hypothetical protein